MKRHSDYITHIKNEEDKIYLRTKHFPVNIRLFHSSPEYKAIILQQCDYIRLLCSEEKEGYKKPHGMSSANAGLAFNIIGITCSRGKWNENIMIMINPKIIKRFGNQVESLSNCGSLTLEEPIKVRRYDYITVLYYNERGELRKGNYTRETGSLTIQHEVDHNLGILITDRK